MTPREMEKLLGGYASGTLGPAERDALLRAALDDQALFDALADEEALRDLLSDPAARSRLIEALQPAGRDPVPADRLAGWLAGMMDGLRRFFSSPLPLSLAGSLAVALIAFVSITQLRKQQVTTPYPDFPAPLEDRAFSRGAPPEAPAGARAKSQPLPGKDQGVQAAAESPRVVVGELREESAGTPAPSGIASSEAAGPGADRPAMARPAMARPAMARPQPEAGGAEEYRDREEPQSAAAPAPSLEKKTLDEFAPQAAPPRARQAAPAPAPQVMAMRSKVASPPVEGAVAANELRGAAGAGMRDEKLEAATPAEPLRYHLERGNPDGSFTALPARPVLHGGDAIRLVVNPDREGLLRAVLLVAGRQRVLFAAQVAAGSRHAITVPGAEVERGVEATLRLSFSLMPGVGTARARAAREAALEKDSAKDRLMAGRAGSEFTRDIPLRFR